MDTYRTISQLIEDIPIRERQPIRILETLVIDDKLYLPTHSVPLTEGMLVVRARAHASSTRFTKQSEVSFHPDPTKVRINRANLPEHPMFYGSVRSEEVKDSYVLACNEVSERGWPPVQTFTVTGYRVKKRIDLTCLVSTEKQAAGMVMARKMFGSIPQMLDEIPPESRRRAEEILECVGEAFSRDVLHELEYLTSATVAHMLYTTQNALGLSYPSVRNEFKGYNVAILPHLVEDHLELEGGRVMQYQTEGDHTIICCYERFDDAEEPFQWRKVDPMEAHFRPMLEHGYPLSKGHSAAPVAEVETE